MEIAPANGCKNTTYCILLKRDFVGLESVMWKVKYLSFIDSEGGGFGVTFSLSLLREISPNPPSGGSIPKKTFLHLCFQEVYLFLRLSLALAPFSIAMLSACCPRVTRERGIL